MSPEVITIVAWALGAMFAAAAVLALIRIVRGPSIVDRMAGSDTLLTVLICVLASEMALNGHLNTLPLLIALAMTASIGTLAVARFVSRVRRQSDER
ncbi:monovalent cation/H+ antiporter complex subunit F [Gulosibacter macacae]|nr:monovalent cation/H+ antiporter complex subunit F [Gulosibacter macacae]